MVRTHLGFESKKINPLLSPVQACSLQEVAILRLNHQGASGDQSIPARGKGAAARDIGGERSRPNCLKQSPLWGRDGSGFQREEDQLCARQRSLAAAQEGNSGRSAVRAELTGCGCLGRVRGGCTVQGPDRLMSCPGAKLHLPPGWDKIFRRPGSR